MIKSISRAILFSLSYSFFFQYSHALTPPIAWPVSNSFVFVENNINNEYFIATEVLEPRMSGANAWTKLNTEQESLGYMGITGWTNTGYRDMWIENSPVKAPFQGIRCIIGTGVCPSTGFIKAAFIDDQGFYRTYGDNGVYGGADGYASFSPAMYEFLKNMGVGNSQTFDLNYCTTYLEYNPATGGRCKDAAVGIWNRVNFTATKRSHLNLIDLNTLVEIWISSDGTPNLTEKSTYCQNVTGTDDASSGIACKLVHYNAKSVSSIHNNLFANMKLNTNALGFTPNSTYIKIKGDSASSVWKNYNDPSISLKTLLVEGEGDIHVFFTKAFFKDYILYSGNTQNIDNIFTFLFTNPVAPDSGYYQFSTSMKINVIPREYSISIKPTDLSQTHLEGKIGPNEPNLTFNYTVTQSAPRKADVVTVEILGDKTTVNGQTYCLFRSDDSILNVPIPAYLAFTDAVLGNTQKYSGCDENQKLDITNALWTETPWDVNNSGYYYSTSLSLIFPMNNSVSETTIEGNDWMGSVHAEGDIKVDAKWIGVNN
ncbi:hypothetical protein [Acinetobacter baumannii]|uniref:hypothetical protein n=1 Tax=Acinetobacter baumannii TaxID=470 RepID=UPI00233FC242|nr:hypothetical protein [Acinetobacter baumannii]